MKLFVAESELQINQIQDLVEVLPTIPKIAIDHEVKYNIQIVIEGKEKLSNEVIEKINDILRKVSKDLTFTK